MRRADRTRTCNRGFGDRCATNCATALRRPASTTTVRTRRTAPSAGRGSTGAPGHGSSWRTSTAGGPLYATERRGSNRPDGPPADRRPPTSAEARAVATLCQYGPVSEQHLPPRPPASPPASAAIAESATLAVDAKAKALKAAGRPVIGFGAGEPDFPTPEYIVDAAVAACADPANHRYTPAAGLPALREAIAAKTLRDSGYEVDAASQVLVTNGGKQAVYQAFATIVDPGDEVLLPAPYWTTYPEAIRLAGGVPVEVFAGADQGYLVTVEQLEAARTPRTKVLLFCSPSNPTGAVYSPEQTEAIGRWALEHGIWVITDEIYEHLTYDDAVFTPDRRARCPSSPTRTIVLNGVAKTYAMTGWRVGWMIGPADVIKAATNLQSHLTSNVANVSQRAAIAALTGDLSAVDDDARRRSTGAAARWSRCSSAIDGVVCPTPQGAFYAYPSVEGVLGRTIRGVTPADVRRARHADPRAGRGRGGAGRGLRAERVPAAVVRARRRRPRRGRRPDPALLAEARVAGRDRTRRRSTGRWTPVRRRSGRRRRPRPCGRLGRMTTTSPRSTCRDLHKRYGDKHAVDGLDLAVERGEIFAVLGPNGAGKTTTVEILEGFRHARRAARCACSARTRRRPAAPGARASASCCRPPTTSPRPRSRELVHHFAAVLPGPARPRRGDRRRRAAARRSAPARASCPAGSGAASTSRSASSAAPSCCSSTSRRRASTPRRAARSGTSSRGCATSGTTILLTTHYLDEAERLADRVAVVARRARRRARRAGRRSAAAPRARPRALDEDGVAHEERTDTPTARRRRAAPAPARPARSRAAGAAAHPRGRLPRA